MKPIAIFANDTKKIAEWYKNLFECDIIYDNGKGTYFIAFKDTSMIEFCPSETDNVPVSLSTPGIRHIAISIDENDFDALTNKVKNTKTEILKDAQVDAKGIGTMFFRDIEGNILHLISRKTPLI